MIELNIKSPFKNEEAPLPVGIPLNANYFSLMLINISTFHLMR
jgi:hypothetical protein